jgi:hypothetical protein
MSSPLFTTECDSGIYTKYTGHIQYEPHPGVLVTPEMLYDMRKCNSLKKEINEVAKETNMPDEVKMFLMMAATRHIKFNYHQIAEYYAQAPKEVQELMEKSGLVIIDFNDAIENGFVELTETLKDLRDEENA